MLDGDWSSDVCSSDLLYTEPGDPTKTCFRESIYEGNRYHFCSDGCKEIFDDEPEKYVQAWLPIQQIFQGNCGGPTVPDVLNWYQIKVGTDNAEYVGSEDHRLWESWHARAVDAAE
jgi:phenol hydroxylase P3 protein